MYTCFKKPNMINIHQENFLKEIPNKRVTKWLSLQTNTNKIVYNLQGCYEDYFIHIHIPSFSNESKFLRISPKQNVPDIVNHCLYLDLISLDSSKLSRHCWKCLKHYYLTISASVLHKMSVTLTFHELSSIVS